MNKIENIFKDNKTFISFITAGDPDIETTEKLIYALEEAGSHIIEIGIPFSDPMAESIAAQSANERALKNGCTVDKVFDMLERVREKTDITIIFLTYLNPIFSYGKEKFFKRGKKAGLDGVIVPDLPFEEKDEISQECKKYGVTLISQIAPTSRKRIAMIAKEAQGFIHCVHSLGGDSVKEDIKKEIEAMVDEVKKVSDLPCAMGFELLDIKQEQDLIKSADGIIIDNEIGKIIEEKACNSINAVGEYVKKTIENIK